MLRERERETNRVHCDLIHTNSNVLASFFLFQNYMQVRVADALGGLRSSGKCVTDLLVLQ